MAAKALKKTQHNPTLIYIVTYISSDETKPGTWLYCSMKFNVCMPTNTVLKAHPGNSSETLLQLTLCTDTASSNSR